MNREAEAALRTVAENFAATREDLERIASSLHASPVPLIRDFAPEAAGVLTGRTLDTYRHHFARLVKEFGERRLDEVTLLDLDAPPSRFGPTPSNAPRPGTVTARRRASSTPRASSSSAR